ncbi:MAG: hypothetical protein U5K28_00665 [Halobacteriales archaeon]|nr:hypothetical protein [Halobacteriales archaeon]
MEPTIDDADEDVIPPHDRPDEESPDESAEADETAPKTGFEASSMSVGDALAAEIRDGGLDDETRETLSTAFGPGLSPDQQAQLDRIQSQIEDLSETVAPLDETEPAAALDALRADVDDLRADIEELS